MVKIMVTAFICNCNCSVFRSCYAKQEKRLLNATHFSQAKAIEEKIGYEYNTSYLSGQTCLKIKYFVYFSYWLFR